MKRCYSLFLLNLIIIILCLSFYSFFTSKPQISDSLEYKNAASNLLNNSVLYSGNDLDKLDYRLFAKRTVGYPIFILLNWQSNLIMIVSQVLLVLLTFFLSLRVLRQFTLKTWTIRLFVLFFTTYFALLFHSFFILSDLLLLAILSVVITLYYEKHISTNSKLISIGILWSAALLVKPVLLPSLLIIPLIVIWFGIKKKVLAWQLTIPILVFIFGCTLNMYNSRVFEYSSISSINLIQYNAKLTIAKAYGFDSAQAFVVQSLSKVPTTKVEYDEYRSKSQKIGTSVILNNPSSYFKIQVLGMIKMLIDPGRYELYTFFSEPTSNESLTELVFGNKWGELKSKLQSNYSIFIIFIVLSLLGVLKLIGFIIGILNWKRCSLMLIIILYSLVIVGPLGAARFFLPVGLMYLIISVLGFENLLDFFKKRSKS